MCGITGIFHFDSDRPVDRSKLKRMTDLVHHRGPDGEGYHLDQNIGLGHRRLSIIDLDTGDQPMFNQDRSIAVILNGEIYNYVELREELIHLGHQFKTTSDTEVIIKAYEQWGVECQNRFNGMWAFALWDTKEKRLILSRDRIGEKPLHYAVWDDSLIFGSEIKSLLEYGIPAEPRLELLEIYAVFKSIPAPHTFYKGIQKLLPGHYLIVDTDGPKEHCYWDLPAIDEANLNKDTRDVQEQFQNLLQDAVRIRMRSDVPYGAFLSGGLDSSSVVALMSDISQQKVNTFTIGYDEKEFDESQISDLVAKRFNTEHFLGKISDDPFSEVLDRIAFHYDEPFGDSSAIPTGYVSKFAAEKVKMVLTGDGGDEVLSGYPSYQGIKFAQYYQSLPRIIRNGLYSMVSFTASLAQNSYRYKLNRYGHLLYSSSKSFNERLIEKRAKPGTEIIQRLVAPGVETWDVGAYLNEYMEACPYQDDFYKQMYFNFKFDLPNDYLVKVDRMSMAYSLECRVPFLDHRLIECMVKADKTVKMPGWQSKSVLRKTIGKRLPDEVLKGSKKGFRVPVREWMKSESISSRLAGTINAKSIFDDHVLNQLIQDNSLGKADNGNLLWSLLVLSKSMQS